MLNVEEFLKILILFHYLLLLLFYCNKEQKQEEKEKMRQKIMRDKVCLSEFIMEFAVNILQTFFLNMFFFSLKRHVIVKSVC